MLSARHVSQVFLKSAVTPPHITPLPSFFRQAYAPFTFGLKNTSPSLLRFPSTASLFPYRNGVGSRQTREQGSVH